MIIYTDLLVRRNHETAKWCGGRRLSLLQLRRLKNLDEFILDGTVSCPYYNIYQSSDVECGRRFLQHHQMGRHCLACVGRRQTVCLGTHTICSSLVSTSFPSIEALFTFFSFKLNQISLGVGSGWREDLPSLAFIIWLQILSIHFLFHAGPLPIFLLLAWLSAATPQEIHQLLALGSGAQSDWAATGGHTWMCLAGPSWKWRGMCFLMHIKRQNWV